MIDCWHRYDELFEPSHARTQSNSQAASTNEEQKGQPLSSNQASSFLAHQNKFNITTNLESQTWFVNLGDSHHLTSNQSYLYLTQHYLGINEVLVGNDQGLKIKSISSAKIKSHIKDVLRCL